jgi:hypothetical protein
MPSFSGTAIDKPLVTLVLTLVTLVSVNAWSTCIAALPHNGTVPAAAFSF